MKRHLFYFLMLQFVGLNLVGQVSEMGVPWSADTNSRGINALKLENGNLLILTSNYLYDTFSPPPLEGPPVLGTGIMEVTPGGDVLCRRLFSSNKAPWTGFPTIASRNPAIEVKLADEGEYYFVSSVYVGLVYCGQNNFARTSRLGLFQGDLACQSYMETIFLRDSLCANEEVLFCQKIKGSFYILYTDGAQPGLFLQKRDHNLGLVWDRKVLDNFRYESIFSRNLYDDENDFFVFTGRDTDYRFHLYWVNLEGELIGKSKKELPWQGISSVQKVGKNTLVFRPYDSFLELFLFSSSGELISERLIPDFWGRDIVSFGDGYFWILDQRRHLEEENIRAILFDRNFNQLQEKRYTVSDYDASSIIVSGEDSFTIVGTKTFGLPVMPGSITYLIKDTFSLPQLAVCDNFQVYPIPADLEINVDIPNSRYLGKDYKFNLYDYQGRLIQEGALSERNNSIIVSEIPEGIYFLSIGVEGDNHCRTEKILISRK